MTPHDLTAGRELDALIAEKVMEWVWVKHRLDVNSVAPGQRYLCDIASPGSKDFFQRYCEHATMEDPICEEAKQYVPAYSTDIAAAWLVVDKMNGIRMIENESLGRECDDAGHRQTYDHFVCQLQLSSDCKTWSAVFIKTDMDWGSAIEATAPLAICKAALAACKEG